jgi:hypothetical protein
LRIDVFRVLGVVVFGPTAAIVAGEHQQRVLPSPNLFERRDNFADGVIEMHHAGGILPRHFSLDL